ncbi:hypothetical protein H7X87_01825 [Acetobacteraceae bacterium]|nr:hypothetical protein [Candidatus Parcubacteria bacterium]
MQAKDGRWVALIEHSATYDDEPRMTLVTIGIEPSQANIDFHFPKCSGGIRRPTSELIDLVIEFKDEKGGSRVGV